jgi:capsular polysaccharide transport system permease protein
VILTVGYLMIFAQDQYHSDLAFSVRSEDRAAMAAAGLLGAITQIGGGSASDADILEGYIRSAAMVGAADRTLDLRRMFGGRPSDPVFALPDGASREDLTDYWQRMVHVTHDRRAGILHVRADAFSAADAQAVAKVILAESGRLVNDLSEQARHDAVRFSETDLTEAEARLRALRGTLAELRRDTQILDPAADMAGQMGVVEALQTELAQALIDRDMLLTYADAGDHRVVKADARIQATRVQIEAERASLGSGSAERAASDVMGRYEALLTDIEFASAAYMQALTNLSVARAEARRQTRYLPVHIQPTLAETALYPRRAVLTGIAGGFLMLVWAALMVLYYNLRDAR